MGWQKQIEKQPLSTPLHSHPTPTLPLLLTPPQPEEVSTMENKCGQRWGTLRYSDLEKSEWEGALSLKTTSQTSRRRVDFHP